ncbi:MAG: diguanylate cyclase [Chloroflexota bacterium]
MDTPPAGPAASGPASLETSLQEALDRSARLAREAADSSARLQAVHDLSWRLNAIHDVAGLGEAIVTECHRLIGHDTIRVYRVDHATGTCEPIAFRGQFMGVEHPSPEMLRIPVGRGLTGWVAEHNATIRTADAELDPRAVTVGEARGAESLLVVPMANERRVVGVIVVSRLGFDHFTENDQRLMETFAGYAAQAIVNAENMAELERQRAELARRLDSQRRLMAVNERLLATLDAEGVLDLIADSLAVLVRYETMMVYRVDRAAGIRRPVLARGPLAERIMAHWPVYDAGLNGWVTVHGEPVLSNEAHLDPRAETIPGTDDEPESMIVCPLTVSGAVEGTLTLSRGGGPATHFSAEEFDLVRLFATQAAIAIHNADTHRVVRSLADTDTLTGVRSRGSFDRELDERIEHDHPFALVMLDLDRFKAFNDRFGHRAGDALLARVGSAIGGAMRDGDRAYRYGGDEFALVIPRVDAVEATVVAERVRSAIEALTAPSGPSAGNAAPGAVPDPGAGVGASVGLAMFPAHGVSSATLVEAADRELYRDKLARHG